MQLSSDLQVGQRGISFDIDVASGLDASAESLLTSHTEERRGNFCQDAVRQKEAAGRDGRRTRTWRVGRSFRLVGRLCGVWRMASARSLLSQRAEGQTPAIHEPAEAVRE